MPFKPFCFLAYTFSFNSPTEMPGGALIENILLEGEESPRRKKKILRFAIVVGVAKN
jgi:hypothetical protein